ncbi:MAG TPA: proton-conducting transporter membrane subunit, partial [Terriglobales bacterium]|nr:proton-conducting transporter membrane subunit [Terriglobales bacterium]
GVGAFSMGIFHLMTHAFFKGLLFLAAGSVIHAIGGEQDMRKMGGLRTKIPWTFWTMTAGTFAIAGFPPLAGFFSKDAILHHAFKASWIYWAIGVFTAFLTSFYMFRQWFLTFFGEYRGEEHAGHGHGGNSHGGVHESPKVMLVPLAILAILSVCGGWMGSERFDKFLSPAVHAGAVAGEAATHPAAEEGPSEGLLASVSIAVAILGFGLAWLLYWKDPELPQKIAAALGGLYDTVLHKYYVDEIYAAIFVKPLIEGSSRVLWQTIDQRVIDKTFDDSADAARGVSDPVRHMQSGNIRSYAGWMAAGAAGVIAYMIWMGTR